MLYQNLCGSGSGGGAQVINRDEGTYYCMIMCMMISQFKLKITIQNFFLIVFQDSAMLLNGFKKSW